MCRVSASILNCPLLSQALRTVILYFLIYKGWGKHLQEDSSCVWLHTSCPRLESRGKVEDMYFFLLLQELCAFGTQALTAWKALSTTAWSECGVWPV